MQNPVFIANLSVSVGAGSAEIRRRLTRAILALETSPPPEPRRAKGSNAGSSGPPLHDILSSGKIPFALQGAPVPFWLSDLTPGDSARLTAHPKVFIPLTAPTSTWPALTSCLLSSGYRSALTYLTGAILVNQLRYMFTPGIGSYIWNTPLEDLRLARSNPDIFLSDLLDTPWRVLLLSPVQRCLTAWLFALAAGTALGQKQNDPKQSPKGTQCVSLLFSLTHILYTAEYALTLLIHTASIIIAIYLLATYAPSSHRPSLTSPHPFIPSFQSASSTVIPPPPLTDPTSPTPSLLTGFLPTAIHPSFIENVSNPLLAPFISRSPLKTLYLLLLALHNLAHAIIPLMYIALHRLAAQKQPALFLTVLSTIGAVYTLLRYRSTFFIALQVHRVFVALGFILGGALLLGVEYMEGYTPRKKGQGKSIGAAEGVEKEMRKMGKQRCYTIVGNSGRVQRKGSAESGM